MGRLEVVQRVRELADVLPRWVASYAKNATNSGGLCQHDLDAEDYRAALAILVAALGELADAHLPATPDKRFRRKVRNIRITTPRPML